MKRKLPELNLPKQIKWIVLEFKAKHFIDACRVLASIVEKYELQFEILGHKAIAIDERALSAFNNFLKTGKCRKGKINENPTSEELAAIRKERWEAKAKK